MTKPSRYASLMDAPQAVPQHRPIPRVSGDQSMPGTLHAKPPQFIFFVPFSKLSPCTSSPHPRLLHAYCFLIALCASPKLPVRGIRHCSRSSQRELAASLTAGRGTSEQARLLVRNTVNFAGSGYTQHFQPRDTVPRPTLFSRGLAPPAQDKFTTLFRLE